MSTDVLRAFQLFGLTAPISIHTAKTAYLALALAHHPDYPDYTQTRIRAMRTPST